MAMFLGHSREALLRLLRGLWARRHLPLTLGSPAPQAVVELVDGEWRIRRLVLDKERANAEGRARLARGETWMPEMEWRFLEPAETLVAARSKREFIVLIREMDWPFG